MPPTLWLTSSRPASATRPSRPRTISSRFPDAHDSYDRPGMVCEARKDSRQAADDCRKVIACLGEHPDDDAPQSADACRNLVDQFHPHEPKPAD